MKDIDNLFIEAVMKRQVNNNRGFTLIETLVAFMILSISLVVVLELFSGSLKSIQISNDYEHGLFHAKKKMEEILVFERLDPVRDQGELADGYKWYVEVVPERNIPEDRPDAPLGLFNIKVKVEWRKFGRVKDIVLTTQKVAQRTSTDA